VSAAAPPKERKRKRVDWVVLKDNAFLCLRCEDKYPMHFPAPIDVLAAAGRAYVKSHRHCRPRKEATK
jgi:hypothetical protein